MRIVRVVDLAPGRARLMRFALVLAAALALGMALRHAYGSLLLPLWTFEARLISSSPIVGAEVKRAGADEVVEMRVLALRAVASGGRVRLAQVRVTASTLLGYAVLHPVLLFALLALAARGWRHYAGLVLAGLPFLAMVEALDLPLVLAEQLHVPDLYAGVPVAPESPWTRFMDGGGRYALCIAAAAGAFGAHAWVQRRRR